MVYVVVGTIRVNYAINFASQLTQLYSSNRLIFILSYKEKLIIIAQLEAKIK